METRRNGFLAVDRAIWSASPFVGRERELALIWKQYQAAKERSSSVTLLVGEPGIGKTRLLNEFAQDAIRDGAIVLRGSAFEADGMPPYLPFLEALGRYIRTTPWKCLREQIAHAPYTLLSIFPELAAYLNDEPVSYALPKEQERLRLYEAIGLFLDNISMSQTLVLILDDLHWVDSASLDLLYYITRHHARAKLLIIGAYRESEVDRNPALNRTLPKLICQRMLTTIEINPLTFSETTALAVNYLGGPIETDISFLLHTQSEGNPFFAEELIQYWTETKALVRDGVRWSLPSPLEYTLPSSIIGTLRQRFTLLSSQTISHLRVAAIIGRTFDLALLATVEGQEIEHLEEHLEEAQRAQLVHSEQDGVLTFNHDNIRACLYAEVSASRRRRLHEKIGRILEARYEKESTKSAYELAAIAFHFTHSDDTTQAMIYDQQALEQALHLLAVEGKNVRRVEFIERCKQLQAYSWLAFLFSLQGSWDEAELALIQAHPTPSPESLSLLWHMRGFLAYQQEDYAAAEHHFQMVRGNLQNNPVDFLLSTSMLGLSQASMGKSEEAATILNELETIVSVHTDDPLQASLAPVLTCMTFIAIVLDDQQRMETFYPKLLLSHGKHYLFLVDRVLGEISVARGEWEMAQLYLNEAETEARHRGLQPELARILQAKANTELKRGKAKSKEHVTSILTSVLQLFETLHLSGAASRTRAWLNALSHNIYDTSPFYPTHTVSHTNPVHEIHTKSQGLPASLTRSEARVLQLVVQGKSNRQIAQELGISKKTVDNHLYRIFSKTGSENRTAAAAFAILHRIV